MLARDDGRLRDGATPGGRIATRNLCPCPNPGWVAPQEGAPVDVRVHGKNIKVDEDLRELAEKKLGRAGRIFGDDAVVDVEFSEQANPRISDGKFRVEVTTMVAGQIVRVESAAHEERTALDLATDKLERQLRRLKERLIERGRSDAHKQLNREAFEAEDDEAEDGLAITRVKSFALKPMLPEEAALQMDLLGHSFFFFFNGETDRFGVLYRRRDGSLGLIEPS